MAIDPARTRKINAVERQKRGNGWWRHRGLSRTGRMSWANWFIMARTAAKED